MELLELSAAVERLEPKQFDNGLNPSAALRAGSAAAIERRNDLNVWNRPQAEEVVTSDVKKYFFGVT